MIQARTTTTPSLAKPAEALSNGLNSPFPFYLNDDRKNLLLISVISAFVTVFLYLFKTEAEIQLPDAQIWIHGLVTFFCLSFNILVLPRIFPAAMDPVTWNIRKYVLLNIGHLVLIAMASTLVDKMLICPNESWFKVGGHVIGQVALKGSIPIALTTLFLKAQLLQQNLKEAIQINQELGKIQSLRTEVRSDNRITIYSDTSESLSFNLPDLLFVEADDNYSTVVWREGESIQKKLLRINLKNLETQLNNSFTIRCHRSFIVNVNAIASVSGNTNGYRLKIKDYDFSIPVSRPKGKEVMEKISQLRNFMELA